jgi:hypothetical protein
MSFLFLALALLQDTPNRAQVLEFSPRSNQKLTDIFVHEGLGELHLFLLTPRVITLSSLPSLPIYKKIRARAAPEP